MGDVVRLVTRAERERARLIRQARANYDSIFPPADGYGELPADHPGRDAQPEHVEGVLVT